MPGQWKDTKVRYDYKGKHVEEEMYLTVDLEGNQIVVLPTCGQLLASQPYGKVDLAKLREDAITKFKSFGKRI